VILVRPTITPRLDFGVRPRLGPLISFLGSGIILGGTEDLAVLSINFK
jgi:hypothetical protein